MGIVQNNVQCGVANDEEIEKKFSIIKKNFDKYEKNFLKKINLKYVVICKNLKVSNTVKGSRLFVAYYIDNVRLIDNF